MILLIESDAAYLVISQACSYVAPIFYRGKATAGHPSLNGDIQVIWKTLQNIISSTDEAETGGVFIGSQQAVPIITAMS